MNDEVAAALDELVPRFENERGSWERVVIDAAARRGPRRVVTRRRLVVLVGVLAAVLIPLAAIAASRDWWFLHGPAPEPVSPVVVVKEGVWDGHPWQLVAFRSSTDGLCFSLTPKADDPGRAGALDCAPFQGVPATPESNPSKPLGITYLQISRDSSRPQFPQSVSGPVVEPATEVVLTFADGSVIRTPTFAAPPDLGAAVRFYAVQLPTVDPAPELVKAAGLDASGEVVACLVIPLPAGSVPLTDCD